MKVLITGIAGLLGSELAKILVKNNIKVCGTVRTFRNVDAVDKDQLFKWDALVDKNFPSKALVGVDVIIHLAGEPVANGRWTKKIKENILNSRVLGTKQIVAAVSMLKAQEQPKLFISGSAIGYYGDCADRNIDETSSPGKDFLSDVVIQWEKEMEKIPKNIRSIILRTGIVLAKNGGALSKMPPVVIGQGQNYMSWIHIADWLQFVVNCLHDQKINGIFNLTAPNPELQKAFISKLVAAKKILFKLWSPQFIVELGLGEVSKVILTSQKVIPEKLLRLKFNFMYPDLETALQQIYRT